jgi:excisionase family DNA binding protein
MVQVSSLDWRVPMAKILLTINDALTLTGIGRSYLYDRLADGSIRSVKAGRRRLVDAASLKDWATSLPQSPLKQSAKGD